MNLKSGQNVHNRDYFFQFFLQYEELAWDKFRMKEQDNNVLPSSRALKQVTQASARERSEDG